MYAKHAFTFTHVKFKIHRRSAMNITGVKVKIYNEKKCVYEHQTAGSKENDLQTLLQNLRDVQSEVNNFLTTLIQQNTSDRAQSNLLYVIVKLIGVIFSSFSEIV